MTSKALVPKKSRYKLAPWQSRFALYYATEAAHGTIPKETQVKVAQLFANEGRDPSLPAIQMTYDKVRTTKEHPDFLRLVDSIREQGIEATLVDLYSLPFDDVAILGLVQHNQGQVLTVEDNYGASLGSAVADALAGHGGAYTLMQMYVRQIPKSGRTPDDVLRALQLSASDIAQTAVRMLDVAAR